VKVICVSLGFTHFTLFNTSAVIGTSTKATCEDFPRSGLARKLPYKMSLDSFPLESVKLLIPPEL
jgi:hypothetical protein